MNVKKLTGGDLSELRSFFNNKNIGKYNVYSSVSKEKSPILLFNDFKKYYENNKEIYFISENYKILGLAGFRKLGWDSEIFGFNCSCLDYFYIEDRYYQRRAFDSLVGIIDNWIKENEIKFMVTKINGENKNIVDLLIDYKFENIEKLKTLRNNLSDLSKYENIENSGNYAKFCPEFSNGQFQKICGPINRIVHKIRAFKEEDIETIGKISAESFLYTRFMKDKRFGSDKASALNYKWAVNCCRGRSDEVLVSDVENKVAGFITCNIESIENMQYGDIQLLAVDKDFRGRGLAKDLVSAAKNWFKENNCKFVDVSTQSDNLPALDIYKKSNFVDAYSQITLHKWI